MHSDWAGLQKDLLGQVLTRLESPKDYLRFSVVCKSWFCLAKKNQRELMSRRSQPPMLLITDEENSWRLYNIIDDKVLDMQLRAPNRRFCGSSKGWLIFVDETFAITLLNPFSVKLREKKKKANATIIRLPPLHGEKWWIRKCDYYVCRASLSSDPILDPEDSVLTVIYGEKYQLAFIRCSKDKRWTYADNNFCPVEDVVYSQGVIYAVDNDSRLFSYNISTLSKLELSQGNSSYANKIYLVFDSDEKEIWMVKRYIKYKNIKKWLRRETTEFKIFKMNIDDEHEWIEKETLGNVAFFVGDNSSVSVVASDFPGCRSNCIYFSHDDDFISSSLEPYGPNDCGVYDIASRRVLNPYAEDAEKLLRQTSGRPPIWFVPHFQL
ncbi:putative F-box protein At5g55150 [Argentina anserina]|uniref:putative F-box protein At5g55150 n=1 Tax=Argentina anserina TaxID=57926 RepID=UPI0021768B51|nr:putative F-box protein At5g55150 [Potentilla anserina]XP_050365476.1 putative F-box protein At5g55150 [Potentilla anserina]